MACILDKDKLKQSQRFIDWVLKIKNKYPDKTDVEIENNLIGFMTANNGNFPGDTPFGDREHPYPSTTFEQLTKYYEGDEVSAMEVYMLMLGKDFIQKFGNWCDAFVDTSGLTDEQIKQMEEENKQKLLKAVRYPSGEPAVLFVNSVNNQYADASSAATTKLDEKVPFKLRIEDGEVRIDSGYGRPVQNGSITFIVCDKSRYSVNADDEIHIEADDVAEMYDLTENKGFTEKRLRTFLSLSGKDMYYLASRISVANKELVKHASDIHSRQDAIAFLREHVKDLIFDEDENSPTGSIQFMVTLNGDMNIWQIMSPEGIFCNINRYGLGVSHRVMTAKSQTNVDRLANSFFVDEDFLKKITDYIQSNVLIVKPDSHLSSPLIDYSGDRFILKPAQHRTQHNIKTEFAMAYAVNLFNNRPKQFDKYLEFAKQFTDIRNSSAGTLQVKDVNMVGNLIGAILSGQIIDSNYYTAHSFSKTAIDQAVYVSKHQNAVRTIMGMIYEDMVDDIKGVKFQKLLSHIRILRDLGYAKIEFGDITDNIARNRVIQKVDENNITHNFCDTIDKAKAAYGYRRNDSGSKKSYDATEYSRVVAIYLYLDSLNKDIKEYLIKKPNKADVVDGEHIHALIDKYLTCIDTIVNTMSDDISKLEYFIWNTEKTNTPEYYQQLLYLDRSVIKMYTKLKTVIESLFNINSENSEVVERALYNAFDNRQAKRFDELRKRYYETYAKLGGNSDTHNTEGSLEYQIDNMIKNAIQDIVNNWCDKNLKCLTEEEERNYRENLMLDLEGHIKAATSLGGAVDMFIGGAASSGHNIINVLYRIIQTQEHRSDLKIKAKGDFLAKKFKDTFDTHSPFNKCKIFCEQIQVKKAGMKMMQTTGYFIRNVNYGLYYRAKVAKQREILDSMPKDESGDPMYYTIDESKSTPTKLVIEWLPGSDHYQNSFLDKMDLWVEENANRKYKAEYYINRRRILSKSRDGIVVGNEAINRLNQLRRQIDGIKNRYRDKDTKVFLPSKVPPVQRKILENLEAQFANLTSLYETYTDSQGNLAIREKQGLDLAIALNIQEWNKFIQGKRKYTQNEEKYREVELKLKARIGKDLTQKDYDKFVEYYHRKQATQEYYDILEERYKGSYGEYQDDIDDIRSRRRSILARVKSGRKGLDLMPNLNKLSDSEWEVLRQLDIRESNIKNKLSTPFGKIEGLTTSFAVIDTEKNESFLELHRKNQSVRTYTDDLGNTQPLSVYYMSKPGSESFIENVLVDEFSTEISEYINNEGFDDTNPSYEQPREYSLDGKKLYKNDEYEKLKNDPKLFELYETFLEIMREANEMFGYAAISSNYKLPQVYENVASIYLGRGCGLLNSWKYKLNRDFRIDERDLDRSYTSDVHADGTSSGKLRKRFVEMLSDPEHISTDIVYSVIAYYATACRYSDKQDIQALCELINRRMDSTSATSADKRLHDVANNVVETFLFENTMTTGGAGAAALEKLMEHTTSSLLKWKLKTAVKAFLDQTRLQLNVVFANKLHMRRHYIQALGKAITQTFTSLRSSIDVIDYDMSEALMSLNDVNILSYADVNKTKFTRAYRRAGLMPMLTIIDHVGTKATVLMVYDSIRLYTSPDGTKRQFLNVEEYINMYVRDHKNEIDEAKDPVAAKIRARETAEKLFYDEKVTLYDAYLLGERDKDGNIIKGKEKILNIKEEYRNMFSKDPLENEELWAIIQTRVRGQINMMAASINGYKPDDTKSASVVRTWYLKPIFQARSFLISNYNELFKNSSALNRMVADTSTRNTNLYIPEKEYKHSENWMADKINRLWASDNGVILFINTITSEREMYNVLTGTKDVGYYLGTMSFIRKQIENLLIYIGSLTSDKKDLRLITDLEKASFINSLLVSLEAAAFYNISVLVGGLICTLLRQGLDPDDPDEWFLHWLLWTMYDIAGSMVNDTLVSSPMVDTIFDIFRNIMAIVPVLRQIGNTLTNSGDARLYFSSLFGDDEVFKDPEYGTNTSPWNLIKSGKWKGEMYGKRYFYETVLHAPWLVTPVLSWPATIYISGLLPDLPLANLKESFSAHAARAKASFTFNNLSPIDYTNLKTPSASDESWQKFHDYGPMSQGARLFNELIGGYAGESDLINDIRSFSKTPFVPSASPVDKIERAIPLGRKYE